MSKVTQSGVSPMVRLFSPELFLRHHLGEARTALAQCLGPQGMGGSYSVMGVNSENTARHPSAIGVAVNVGCWSHRRGHVVFDKDLNATVTTHSGVTL